MAAAPAVASRDSVLADVLQVLSGILGTQAGADEPLMAAGLDSLGAVELQNSLESKLGVRLPSTLIFDYPTAAASADHVVSLLGAATGQRPGIFAHSSASAASVAAHAEHVASEVAAAVSEVLGAAELDLEQSFMAAGLDSLGAVELRNSLEGRLGLSLPGTLVFDYPTPASLSAYITSRLQPAAGSYQIGASLDLSAPTWASQAPGAAAGPVQLSVAALATRPPKASCDCWLNAFCFLV
jgi:acyl carrier protein